MLSVIIKSTVSAPNTKAVTWVPGGTGKKWMPIVAKKIKISLEEIILAVRQIE